MAVAEARERETRPGDSSSVVASRKAAGALFDLGVIPGGSSCQVCLEMRGQVHVPGAQHLGPSLAVSTFE